MGDDSRSPLTDETAVAAPPVEQPGDRARRHARRGVLYGWAIAWVAIIGLIITWVVRNRDSVSVDWIFGSTDAALALVIFIAAALGWALGILTAVLIRRRTRAPRGE